MRPLGRFQLTAMVAEWSADDDEMFSVVRYYHLNRNFDGKEYERAHWSKYMLVDATFTDNPFSGEARAQFEWCVADIMSRHSRSMMYEGMPEIEA